MLELADSDPWSGAAGWAHARRNDAWVHWLERHAPGARLLDCATGAGVLAVLAARLGAERVYAVADQEEIPLARELARRNGVADRVTFHPTLAPPDGERFDGAFCAALGPEPLDALRRLERARPWLADGAPLAPARLRLMAALVGSGTLTAEMSEARAELDRIGRTWDLDLSPVRSTLDAAEPYRWFTASEALIGPAAEVWELRPGDRAAARTVSLSTDGAEAGGVAMWWEIDLDDATSLGGPPGTDAPEPPLVCSWPDPLTGPSVRVRFTTRGGRVYSSSGRR